MLRRAASPGRGSTDYPYLSSIDGLCPAASPDLTQLVERHNAFRHHYVGREITVEPYTLEREAELLPERVRYLSCYYQDFERQGDWIVFMIRERSYCARIITLGAGSCPGRATLSIALCFIFLISNPGSGTLPYLIPYLVFFVSLVALVIYLHRRGEPGSFLKPTRMLMILFLTSLIMIPCWLVALGMLWNPLDLIILWLLLGYPALCLARYVRERRAARPTE